MKKSNEIRVYVKQDIKDKLDYLAQLMEMPTSKLLRLMIEEPTFVNTIINNINLIQALKQQRDKDKSNQLEMDFDGDINTKV